jgi:hypothetical protein
LFTEDHVGSKECQAILNSFLNEWLANPVVTEVEEEYDESGSEDEFDPAVQEEPTYALPPTVLLFLSFPHLSSLTSALRSTGAPFSRNLFSIFPKIQTNRSVSLLQLLSRNLQMDH